MTKITHQTHLNETILDILKPFHHCHIRTKFIGLTRIELRLWITKWTSNGRALRSSGIWLKSRAVIVRYSQKKAWISFVFYCFINIMINLIDFITLYSINFNKLVSLFFFITKNTQACGCEWIGVKAHLVGIFNFHL